MKVKVNVNLRKSCNKQDCNVNGMFLKYNKIQLKSWYGFIATPIQTIHQFKVTFKDHVLLCTTPSNTNMNYGYHYQHYYIEVVFIIQFV